MLENIIVTRSENKVLFDLGQTVMTIGTREALKESNQTANEFLSKHSTGNWGLLCEEDAEENKLSVREGFRILSAYKTTKSVKLWIITEADRSSTTVLLPCQY